MLRRLGNPLRTEAAAFRWLLFVTVCVAVVMALVLVGRAIF